MEKKWIISNWDVKVNEENLNDVVVVLHYRRQLTDGEVTVDTYSTLSLAAPDPANFTPIDQITRPQLIEWLESSLDVQAIDASLERELQEKLNPSIIHPPLPE